MSKKFSQIKLAKSSFGGIRDGIRFEASWPLFIIGEAWHRGCALEDLADGFGPGAGTMGGDWSGIRDSSEAAIEHMTERALNHLFVE